MYHRGCSIQSYFSSFEHQVGSENVLRALQHGLPFMEHAFMTVSVTLGELFRSYYVSLTCLCNKAVPRVKGATISFVG